MQPVLTVAQMNAVDAAAAETTPLEILVGRAGHAVAQAALQMMGGAYGRRVVVVAGPGNNGADGRVAGGILADRGARVVVVDARSAPAVGPADLVIDAAFGTGFRGDTVSALPRGTPVLAVDIPSGVHGDTGEASGAPVAADRTVTFVALKAGLLQGDGADLAGAVSVVDIGLPAGTAGHRRDGDADVAALVPGRGPAREQVVRRRPGGGRVSRHDGGRRHVRPLRLPCGRRHGPPRGTGGGALRVARLRSRRPAAPG